MSTLSTDTSKRATRAARVLVVDDNPVNCELFEAMLVPEGYEVEQVHSGPEALESAARTRPDIVLLDVNMPEMDGFEVARRLREADLTRTIPVVMVTALGDLEHRVRGLESGADDYLTKPVSQVELLARVQSSLRLSWLRQQVDERRKLELVLGDVSDGIVIVDSTARVVDVSPSARRLLNVETSAPSIEAVWGDLHGTPLDLRRAIEQGEARDFTVRRDTPPLFLGVNMRPVHDPAGNVTGAVLLLRDVTQESLDRRIQQDVLSLIGHKFRTPLTVVQSWAGVLLEEGCGKLGEQQREAMHSIAASTEQLRELVDAILAYVEWTQRLQHLQKQRAAFSDLARELRQRVDAELDGEDLFTVERCSLLEHRLTVEHDDGDVEVDVALFVDALLELVRNARKFGADDTAVRVTMRHETDAADGGELERVIEVEDDGPGIPPEHLERIFQRFYQVEANFTGQVRGLGLGLSRVQRAIRAMGGQLDVDSKLDQGTRFTIRF